MSSRPEYLALKTYQDEAGWHLELVFEEPLREQEIMLVGNYRTRLAQAFEGFRERVDQLIVDERNSSEVPETVAPDNAGQVLEK